MRYSASIKVLLLAAAFQVVHGVAIPSPVEQQQLLSPDGYPIAVQTFSEINFADGLTLKIYDAPAGQSTNPTEIVKKDLTKRDSHCSGSTFIGRTSTGSPDRLDCHNLRQKFRDAPTLLSWTQRPQLGNDDAADLVRDSVTNYSSGGRVGAEGHMNCEVGPGFNSAGVDWAVFHT